MGPGLDLMVWRGGIKRAGPVFVGRRFRVDIIRTKKSLKTTRIWLVASLLADSDQIQIRKTQPTSWGPLRDLEVKNKLTKVC